jgi:hypothetical protein
MWELSGTVWNVGTVRTVAAPELSKNAILVVWSQRQIVFLKEPTFGLKTVQKNSELRAFYLKYKNEKNLTNSIFKKCDFFICLCLNVAQRLTHLNIDEISVQISSMSLSTLIYLDQNGIAITLRGTNHDIGSIAITLRGTNHDIRSIPEHWKTRGNSLLMHTTILTWYFITNMEEIHQIWPPRRHSRTWWQGSCRNTSIFLQSKLTKIAFCFCFDFSPQLSFAQVLCCAVLRWTSQLRDRKLSCANYKLKFPASRQLTFSCFQFYSISTL